MMAHVFFFVFFFNDPATTEIYTLSLHDALPICIARSRLPSPVFAAAATRRLARVARAIPAPPMRSEEHTSELQSPVHLVCRLLLEKKKITIQSIHRFSQPTQFTTLPIVALKHRY